MTENDLLNLDSSGHIIGLHSYSHPMQLSKLKPAFEKIGKNGYDEIALQK